MLVAGAGERERSGGRVGGLVAADGGGVSCLWRRASEAEGLDLGGKLLEAVIHEHVLKFMYMYCRRGEEEEISSTRSTRISSGGIVYNCRHFFPLLLADMRVPTCSPEGSAWSFVTATRQVVTGILL
jgi:hypothetical protein